MSDTGSRPATQVSVRQPNWPLLLWPREIRGRWFAGYPNAFPGKPSSSTICASTESGRRRALYEHLVAVFRWDSRTEFVQAIKLSMDICGNSYGGPTRPPRTPLTPEQHAQVTADGHGTMRLCSSRPAWLRCPSRAPSSGSTHPPGSSSLMWKSVTAGAFRSPVEHGVDR
jgi:hypothetical protein